MRTFFSSHDFTISIFSIASTRHLVLSENSFSAFPLLFISTHSDAEQSKIDSNHVTQLKKRTTNTRGFTTIAEGLLNKRAILSM